MIWLLLVIILVVFLSKDWEEHSAMCWVGEAEFKKAKNSMTKQEFKKYVKENAKKMKKAEDDAAEYYRNKK